MLVCWTYRQTAQRSNPSRARVLPPAVVSILETIIKYKKIPLFLVIVSAVIVVVMGLIIVVSDVVVIVVVIVVILFFFRKELVSEVQNIRLC